MLKMPNITPVKLLSNRKRQFCVFSRRGQGIFDDEWQIEFAQLLPGLICTVIWPCAGTVMRSALNIKV
jgi:hypothetical protein